MAKAKPRSSRDEAVVLPRYRGKRWIRPGLPDECEDWERGGRSSVGKDRGDHHALAKALRASLRRGPWRWPRRPLFFLTDPHADGEAFVASLVASGGVARTGPGNTDFRLTGAGRQGIFVIGGDCLDKGPSNLQLLDSLRALLDLGPRVKLLAGNHDVRLLLGLHVLAMDRDPRTEHFFVRVGPKAVLLLREIHDAYLQDRRSLRGLPDEKECRRRLYPSKRWFEEFPRFARWVMPEPTVERELARMRAKMARFQEACAEAGMSMRMVYAAAGKARELFLRPEAEFGWFFHSMKLVYRQGSFLFIHAGLDDRIASLIDDKGLAAVNRQFHDQLWRDPFEFYYGPLANAMRTKYREIDMPLTHRGVDRLHRMGIHAVVHGHRNRSAGQRIMVRRGMVHFECDTTMDRNLRRREGLDGYGAGATIIRPQGQVIGISTDHPRAKVFEPYAMQARILGKQ